MKFFLTSIVTLTVVLALLIGQFGLFGKQVNDITQKIDRATAVSRAEAMIAKWKNQADSLQQRSREMKIKARTIELGVEREEEELKKTEFAIRQLAHTIKQAGLPKPSEIGSLTDEEKQTKILFAGKEGTAMDGYNQLRLWQSEYERKKSVLDAKRKLITNQNEVADTMLVKQAEQYAAIEKMQTQLRKLETEREIMAINKELAELGAAAQGVNVGNMGKILDTIQTEIDEMSAAMDVIDKEAGKPTGGEVFSKPEIAPETDSTSSLDVLWED